MVKGLLFAVWFCAASLIGCGSTERPDAGNNVVEKETISAYAPIFFGHKYNVDSVLIVLPGGDTLALQDSILIHQPDTGTYTILLMKGSIQAFNGSEIVYGIGIRIDGTEETPVNVIDFNPNFADTVLRGYGFKVIPIDIGKVTEAQ